MGVYLVLVLKELRSTIARVNDILETTENVVASLSSPVVGLSTALSTFTQGFKIFKSLKDLVVRKEDGEGGE